MKLFCRLLIIWTSISLFFASVTSVLAFSPKDTFDWNYSVEGQQVLGVTTGADSSFPGNSPQSKIPVVCEDPSENYLFKFDTNLTQDNPLYFLKNVDENVKLVLTFDQAKKEEVRLCYAKQRLAEMEKLTTANSNQNIAGMAASYNAFISKAAAGLEELKKQGKDVTALSSLIDAEAARHKLFLKELKLKLPMEAEKGIDIAVMASEKANDTVADVSGKPPVPGEVITRLQALKAQGLLTAEEVQTLISANSRKDAREKLRKYTDANLLPEADFNKMDEAAKNFYPKEFVKNQEMEKFQELKAMEMQKPDDETIKKLQEFAKSYKPGEAVPQDLRRWWGPMVRLEDLQKTTRIDLIDPEILKNRPEDQQKYKEIVERYKPKIEDIDYINKLAGENPGVLNDPAFARIKSFADKFGTIESNKTETMPAQNCYGNTHWASIPFMPGGGYCVPNYEYPAIDAKESKAINSCPPGYHRNSSESPCYPNNPTGGFGGDLPSPGDCPSGYKWKEEKSSPRGGYCFVEFAGTGGSFPSPVSVPSYCPAGQIFVDGKCQTYSPAPGQGCKEGNWNGQKCVINIDCGPGKYQDYNGECKFSEGSYQNYQNRCKDVPIPAGGCGSGYWDMESCSCKKGDYNSGGMGRSQEENCRRANCRWVGQKNACECDSAGGSSGSGGSQEEACRRGTNCTWKGNYCECIPGVGSNNNPEEACKRAPQCRWTGNNCDCGGPTAGWGSGSQEEACRRGTNCTWKGNYCECIPSGGGSPSTNTQPSGGSSANNCGSGYDWNGSYCVQRPFTPPSSNINTMPPPSSSGSVQQPQQQPQQQPPQPPQNAPQTQSAPPQQPPSSEPPQGQPPSLPAQ